MRDRIAAVIVSDRACDNWGAPLPCDLELVDALMAGKIPHVEVDL